MNRIKIVATDTLMKQIKSASYWFMILFPIIIMIISGVIGYFAGKQKEEIAIVADSSLVPYFENNPSYDFKIISENELDKLLDDKEISSYAKVKNDKGLITADYYEGDSSMTEKLILQQSLGQIQNELNLKNAKLDQNQAESLQKTPVINEISDKKGDDRSIGMIIYFVFLFLTYMVSLTFINVVLTETATEKGTKMIEFIFSSVKPGDYFAGKMLGNFFAVLIQILSYIIFGLIGFFIAKSNGLLDQLPISFAMGPDFIGIIIEMVILFLFGIFISLIVAGVLGSFATKVEDAGKYATPLVFLILIFFFLAFKLMADGDVLIGKILSYLPFASTFFMPLRLLNGYANLIEGAIAIAILIVSILVMYKFGEKIYKKNILNYSTDGFLKRNKKKK